MPVGSTSEQWRRPRSYAEREWQLPLPVRHKNSGYVATEQAGTSRGAGSQVGCGCVLCPRRPPTFLLVLVRDDELGALGGQLGLLLAHACAQGSVFGRTGNCQRTSRTLSKPSDKPTTLLRLPRHPHIKRTPDFRQLQDSSGIHNPWIFARHSRLYRSTLPSLACEHGIARECPHARHPPCPSHPPPPHPGTSCRTAPATPPCPW